MKVAKWGKPTKKSLKQIVKIVIAGPSVGFIKNLWSAQRSFDAATSAAMRKLQMKTLVRNATSR